MAKKGIPMLKAGIFLDMENLSRNGGWGMQYNVIKDLVRAQDTVVVRANAYLAIDVERESRDNEMRDRNEKYRSAIRRNGFHLILKTVKRYQNADGEVVLKANADLDLAVDALLQADNLDYILLGSGDGDFLRLVRALQNRGKRVDLLSFDNTSSELKNEVDNYFYGFLIPGLLTSDGSKRDRLRGFMHMVDADKGYGFIHVRTGLSADSVRADIFCHINEFTRNGQVVDNAAFADLVRRRAIIEFEMRETDKGLQAVNAVEFRPD